MRAKSVLMLIFILTATLSVRAETLATLITVEDGLDQPPNATSFDDVIYLSLIQPSYANATSVTTRINEWLGPGMAQAETNERIRVYAPRDPSKRVEFIAALLELQIE